MANNFISLFIAIALFIVAYLYRDTESVSTLYGLGGGALITSIIGFINWIVSANKNIITVFKALFVRRLRLSCSYLYRIRIDDHYLLVKSRKHGKFQPVGGNFKRNQHSINFLKSIEIGEDDKFTNGNRSKDDLRLYIRGYSLSKFLKWYNSPNKEREVSYDREFHEELVETGVIPIKLFPYPIIDFRKQVVRPLMYSPHLKCKEVHVYDVVELVPTEEQYAFLKKLLEAGDTETYKWVKQSTIMDLGFNQNKGITPFEITDHSQVVTNFNYSKSNK